MPAGIEPDIRVSTGNMGARTKGAGKDVMDAPSWVHGTPVCLRRNHAPGHFSRSTCGPSCPPERVGMSSVSLCHCWRSARTTHNRQPRMHSKASCTRL